MRQACVFVFLLAIVALSEASKFDLTCSHDKNTLSNCDDFKVQHMHMNLTVDFPNTRMYGYVDMIVSVIKAGSTKFILDSRHLKIEHIYLLNDQREVVQELNFDLVTPSQVLPIYGTALVISLPPRFSASSFRARIYYIVNNQSESVQFLQPSQTAGKQYPYLFTQSEAIHARSLVPCQDTPFIKSTYAATIRVVQPLVVVMSASLTNQQSIGMYNIFDFELQIPIPAYLIAMGVGALKSVVIGPRSRLWTEQEMIDQGAYEFAETESFIKTAESFLIPYQWMSYDLLLLPPSFPFGGMENPVRTFVTPTLLAGDRSLANVIAHEIAHSWSGNLVTNVNWENFWLNEGFTVFIERRIIARLKGEPEAELQALIGLNGLKADIQQYNQSGLLKYTKLVVDLTNGDPDDAFSSVPYEKGFNFLYYLSKLVGVSQFEGFLKVYFDQFSFKSIDTNQMRTFFLAYFQDKVAPGVLAQIEWDQWFNTEGMPWKENKFDTSLADAAVDLSQLWITNPQEASTHVEFKSWSSNQRAYFLDSLFDKFDKLTLSSLQLMDSVYSLSATKNAELTFRWQMICLKLNYTPIYSSVVSFITSQGRMKFVRPLYKQLAVVNRDLAVSTYQAHRDFYHPIAAAQIAKDLGLALKNK